MLKKAGTETGTKGEEREKEKENVGKVERNKRKIKDFLGEAQGERITNEDVERILGVSDSTATRYLDELEKEGVLRQVGRTGRHVFYEKV